MIVDKNPHPSVQPWSRGPVFPAVIYRTEHYTQDGSGILRCTSWNVIAPSGSRYTSYASYDDAEAAAGFFCTRARDDAAFRAAVAAECNRPVPYGC